MKEWFEKAVQESLCLCKGWYEKTGLTGLPSNSRKILKTKLSKGVLIPFVDWPENAPLPKGHGLTREDLISVGRKVPKSFSKYPK